MDTYCPSCGSALDQTTGLCPNCRPTESNTAQSVDQTARNSIPTATEEIPAPEAFSYTEQEPSVTEQRFSAPKPTRKKKPQIITVIFSVLLTIIFSIVSLCTLLVYNIQNWTNAKQLEHTINTISVEELFDENKSILDKVEAPLEDALNEEIELDKIVEFVEDSTFSTFLSEKVSSLISDIIEGEEISLFTEKEIIDFLDDNAELIEETFHTELDREVIAEIATTVTEDIPESISISEISDIEIPEGLLTLISFVLSPSTLTALLVLSALLIALMYWNSWTRATNSVSIIFIIHGAIALVLSLLTPLAADALDIGNIFVVSTLIDRFVTINRTLGIVLIAVAIVALITKAIICAKLNKKQAQYI